MRAIVALAALAAGVTGALSQTRGEPPRNSAMVKLLNDGYEIRAAFVESTVPYVFLQKATAAYLCRGGPTPSCEKLN